MLIDKELLAKQVTQATTDAWRREINTTLNSVVEFIVKESLLGLSEQLNTIFTSLAQDIDELYTLNTTLTDELQTLKAALEKPLNKEKTNGSKDGGLPQPKRRQKAVNQGDTRPTITG